MVNLEEYLTAVAAYINRDGYVKSAYSNPTWEKALIRCEKPIASDNISLTKDDEKLAKETIKYFLDPEKESVPGDYFIKVRSILSDVVKTRRALERKELPFIASAVQSYLKNLSFQKRREEAEQQRREEEEQSRYVGQIGQKITVEVAKMTYKYINTVYGESILYKFVDGWGNIFVWFTGKELPSDVREITGTVKDHNEFQGVKQTVLTRCKVN